MTEEENYTGIDLSDMIEDPEHYIDPENEHGEVMVFNADNSLDIIPSDVDLGIEVIALGPEDHSLVDKVVTPQSKAEKKEVIRHSYSPRLAMGRIKNIMKMDPDVNIVQQDAVYLVTKATEMFLDTLAKEAYAYLPKNKKTINKRELDMVINRVDSLCFLEGVMDF